MDRTEGESVRVWRSFDGVQELPKGDRKTALRMIDAFVEGARRKRGS